MWILIGLNNAFSFISFSSIQGLLYTLRFAHQERVRRAIHPSVASVKSSSSTAKFVIDKPFGRVDKRGVQTVITEVWWLVNHMVGTLPLPLPRGHCPAAHPKDKGETVDRTEQPCKDPWKLFPTALTSQCDETFTETADSRHYAKLTSKFDLVQKSAQPTGFPTNDGSVHWASTPSMPPHLLVPLELSLDN